MIYKPSTLAMYFPLGTNKCQFTAVFETDKVFPILIP